MRKIRKSTFVIISSLFAISVALLWASASPKVIAQTRSTFAFAPRSPMGFASQSGPLTFMQGLFEAPWRGFDTGIFGSGFGPTSFALGDLDGDGDVDILVGDSFFGSPGVSVLKNNGDQTFAAPVYYSLPLNQVVGEVALSDFDSDGDLDAFATIRGDFDQMLKIMVWAHFERGYRFFMVLKACRCFASVAADSFLLVNELYDDHWWMRLRRDTVCGEEPADCAC